MEGFIKFITNLNAILIIFFGVGINGSLIWYLNWKKKKFTKQDERLKVLEEGQLAMLHNKIYTVSLQHLENSYVTTDDLEDLNYLMQPYKKLGGNGTAERLFNEVHGLKIVKKGID